MSKRNNVKNRRHTRPSVLLGESLEQRQLLASDLVGYCSNDLPTHSVPDAASEIASAGPSTADVGTASVTLNIADKQDAPPAVKQLQVLQNPRVIPSSSMSYDLDRDGVDDVLMLGTKGVTYSGLEQVDNDVKDREAIVLDNRLDPNQSTGHDTDGDGDLDVITVGSKDAKLGTAGNFDNDPNDNEIVLEDPHRDPNASAGYDLDNDGDIDVVVIGTKGVKVGQRGNFDNDAKDTEFVLEDPQRDPNASEGYDLDGDGDNDIIVRGTKTPPKAADCQPSRSPSSDDDMRDDNQDSETADTSTDSSDEPAENEPIKFELPGRSTIEVGTGRVKVILPDNRGVPTVVRDGGCALPRAETLFDPQTYEGTSLKFGSSTKTQAQDAPSTDQAIVQLTADRSLAITGRPLVNGLGFAAK